MTGKHRLPRRSSGRNLAATAAVLTVSALPLATAGSAFADAPPANAGLSKLPFGLGSVAGPLSGALPLAGTTNQQAAVAAANLTRQADQLTARLDSAPSVAGILRKVAPNATAEPFQVAPKLIQQGVGPLTNGVGDNAVQVTSGVVDSVQPQVEQLRKNGVPTVGDVTSTLSGTKLPLFGTVGGLTTALPVTEMLGAQSPVFGALGAAGGL